MKAVTANRLGDGAVVYRRADGAWTTRLNDADRIEDAQADERLDEAAGDAREVAGAYLIDLDDNGAPAGRARIREEIRRDGPTVRPDFAKRAERSR